MKAYVKPELFYEDMQLSQSIARCDWNYDNTLTSPNDCTASMDGLDNVVIFTNTNCVVEANQVGPDSYCITNGTSGQSTFNS